MSERTLIKENNKLRKKLNSHNKQVYEDILIYIRMNYTSENEDTEEVLNDLLLHVIQAQEDGKDIENVTGEDYKSYADSIITELPRRNVWKLAGVISLIFLGITYLFSYVTDLAFNLIDGAPAVITINLLAEFVYIITVSAVGAGFVFLIFHTMQYTLFKNWPGWKEYGLIFIIGTASFLFFTIITFLIGLINTGPSLEVNMWIFVLLGVTLMTAGLYLLFNLSNNAGQYDNQ